MEDARESKWRLVLQTRHLHRIARNTRKFLARVLEQAHAQAAQAQGGVFRFVRRAVQSDNIASR